MKDDIPKNVSSAYQALERVREEAIEEARLDKKARQSSIRLESILQEQAELLREANERAASMEKRAEESDREAKVAKRHAIWANVIALLALTFTVFQYLPSN
jgi:hypothetical protein